MIVDMRQSRLLRALVVPLVILAWLAVVVFVAWLLGHITHTLLILILAMVVAFALTPLVNLFVRWMPRVLAIALSYLIGLAVAAGLLSVVVVSAATEITTLAHSVPAYARSAQALEPQVEGLLGRFGVSHDQIVQAEGRLVTYLQGISSQAATTAFDLVKTILNTIIDMVFVLILSVYLVANGHRIVTWLREQAPISQRRRTNVLIAIVNQVIGGYVRGTLTMALLVGTLVFLGMTVLRVRYALLLGIVAFFMEFIPVLGVFISGALCVVIALFQGWVLALIVLAYFIGVHVIEGDVVGPRVMGRAVGIHPGVALLALAAGSELFGLWGALFGAPIAGLLQAIATAAWREVRQARITEVTSETPGEVITATRERA